MEKNTAGFLDGKPHDITCDVCKATVTSTVGELRRATTLECPNGHPLEFDSAAFDESIRKSEQRVADIMNRFTFG